ncbi:MAG: threonine synthase [Pyrodictiaceae archaeon]
MARTLHGPTRSALVGLQCTRCGRVYDPDKPMNICPRCGGVLYPIYDLEAVRETFTRESLSSRPWSLGLWRYEELLPIRRWESRVSLGEGSTPLVRAERLSKELGLRSLYVKDESHNPTGTFKARGMAVAVSRLRELGVTRLGLPSAGNAASALAAYAARAGVEAYLYVPRSTPRAMRLEAEVYGAKLVEEGETIADAARRLEEEAKRRRLFVLTTMKEPYRVEGKKTMGIEVLEQLDWKPPDVIVYPTGGGTGLLGIWKAIEELKAIGLLVEEKTPRMVAVQSTGCAPIVEAFEQGASEAKPWPRPRTIAIGLMVPKPYADYLILDVVRKSRGRAIAVNDNEILEAARRLSRSEGILACPEGAATIAAIKRLVDEGWLDKDETIVAVNTGTGLKYLDVLGSQHQ